MTIISYAGEFCNTFRTIPELGGKYANMFNLQSYYYRENIEDSSKLEEVEQNG